MTVVFVHGVPETAAVWDELRDAADRWDTAVTELPGLGHFWMVQDPAGSAEVLRAWLTERQVAPVSSAIRSIAAALGAVQLKASK
jgi:pimeloyl-ACP methyl ester carboxylesterase